MINRSIIKSVPSGTFENVSIENARWKSRFRSLVMDRKPISFEVFTMPTIPADIEKLMDERGYVDLILESDHDQHYLIPRTS